MSGMVDETTNLELAIQRMTEIVEEGRWIRDKLHETVSAPGGGYRQAHCALGLINQVTVEGILEGYGSTAIYDLLVEAIPEREFDELFTPAYRAGNKINGGTARSVGAKDDPRKTGIIASYNNTRKGEGEILSWFDRAARIARGRHS